jgi:CheY-like chemotaxis protein
VVSDEQMPRMTGRELCEQMRSNESYRATPVVLLTAKCLELDRNRLRGELGVAEILSKPFSPRQLVETLRRLQISSPRAG